MKTKILTISLLFISSCLVAQTSLTYQNNSLITGDPTTYRETQFLDPGKSGPNQVWDFSGLLFTGKGPVGTIQTASTPKMTGVSDYNLTLSENGYDYFMNSSNTDLEELGYVNNELKLVLKYSDPVIRMKYPFSYGQQFTDHFIGVADYNGTSTIDFFGDCTVSADGYGTLILPDRLIENTLRIKSVKKGLQINLCGTVDVNIVKYSWYATGYRYPVLNLNIVENVPNNGLPTITKTAFTNTQQLHEQSAILGNQVVLKSLAPATQIEKTDIKVILSPNPFTTKLIYCYILPESRNVSIELYDLSGKYIGLQFKNQPQTEGTYTSELDQLTKDLMPGVYFVRFTFDNQQVICKAIKL